MGVFHIVDKGRRRLGSAYIALILRRKASADIMNENIQRPTVADGVMSREDQHRLLRSQNHNRGADEGAPRQIEHAMYLLVSLSDKSAVSLPRFHSLEIDRSDGQPNRIRTDEALTV